MRISTLQSWSPAIGTSDTDGGGGVDEVQRVQGDLDLRHPWSSEAELRTPGRKKYSDNKGGVEGHLKKRKWIQ